MGAGSALSDVVNVRAVRASASPLEEGFIDYIDDMVKAMVGIEATMKELRRDRHGRKDTHAITDVKGPLVFLNKTEPVAYGEIVSSASPTRTSRTARCSTRPTTMVRAWCSSTAKVDNRRDARRDVLSSPAGTDLVGRILDGAGRPGGGSSRTRPTSSARP